ncbi:unnamed protein product, partial [Linum tenue]
MMAQVFGSPCVAEETKGTDKFTFWGPTTKPKKEFNCTAKKLLSFFLSLFIYCGLIYYTAANIPSLCCFKREVPFSSCLLLWQPKEQRGKGRNDF